MRDISLLTIDQQKKVRDEFELLIGNSRLVLELFSAFDIPFDNDTQQAVDKAMADYFDKEGAVDKPEGLKFTVASLRTVASSY